MVTDSYEDLADSYDLGDNACPIANLLIILSNSDGLISNLSRCHTSLPFAVVGKMAGVGKSDLGSNVDNRQICSL
jgi:hypothetical protein